VTAVLLVQVLTAFSAKSLAIGLADGADRHFEQGVLAQKVCQIDLGIFGHNEFRIRFGALVEGKQLGERPIQLMVEVSQTAHTFQRGLGGKIGLHEQPLRRSADVDNALEVAKFEVVVEGDFVEGKREIVTAPDFLVDDKADIDTEGSAWVGHGRGKDEL